MLVVIFIVAVIIYAILETAVDHKWRYNVFNLSVRD